MSEYYVYAHKDGDEIVYIGKGKHERAWNTNRSYNIPHQEWMRSQLPFLNVEILNSGLSNGDALIIERELILELDPKFNCLLSGKTSKLSEGDVNRLLDEVERGTPQKEICEMFGITRKTVYNIKEGRTWAVSKTY